LDLQAALAHAAADLETDGFADSLDVRRSRALGVIARHYLGTGHRPATKPRQVTIHVHLRDQDTGRCETTRSPISVEQVQGWCTNPATQVIIKPVIDLNAHLRVDAYEVPDRLTAQATERDGSCVHPWCTRPAHTCDHDHCIPYDTGGPTSSDNIAPLCRRHHRTKTHGRWRYRFLRPGHYLWTSPTGLVYYRDATGTVDLGRLMSV
ncbi:MAG TPA: HNH endonuclease signature motif containing protein, partial [Nocardioides sp.]|nr:HNH endonuclease signature motif containing protein [Nocardioides sp.]